MTITAKGEYLARDLRRAQGMHTWALRYFPRMLYFLIAVFLASAVHFAWIGQTSALVRPLLFAAVAVIFYYLIFIYSIRKQLESPTLRGEIEIAMTESGVEIRTDHSVSETHWDGLIRWRERGDLILVYPTHYVYYLLPRRFFSNEEDWRSARTLLHEKIGAAS